MTGSGLSEGPPKKRKKKFVAKSKLSFRDDDNDETGSEPIATSREPSEPRSISNTPIEDSPKAPAHRITANPNAPPPPKAITKAALEAEAQARDALRKEFLAMQESIKATEILIPFVFYDGTNIPAGTVKVKKGDHIWLFLDRCRKVGAELGVGGASGGGRGRKDNRREWARVSVDDLMLIRGEIIIPHVGSLFRFPHHVLIVQILISILFSITIFIISLPTKCQVFPVLVVYYLTTQIKHLQLRKIPFHGKTVRSSKGQ
jgi:protein FAM50